jgi:hypothetical protein
MSLLEDIQNAAVNGQSDLGEVLRKCKVLAARLGSKPLEDWLLWESNGYPDDAPLPDYRIWDIQLKGHFSGPAQSMIKNASIPAVCVPKQYRERFTRHECRRSVAAIHDLAREAHSGILHIPFPNLSVVLGENVMQHMNCVEAWGFFGKSQLVEVLNSVRNRILDFALALWKENPSAGDTGSTAPKIEPAKVNQIFNTTVYGGPATVVGSAAHSTLSFDIMVNDIAGLERALRDAGINSSDVAELKEAIASDPTPRDMRSLGPRVRDWIANMTTKAAKGAWDVGIEAAGGILAAAISRYYGIT